MKMPTLDDLKGLTNTLSSTLLGPGGKTALPDDVKKSLEDVDIALKALNAAVRGLCDNAVRLYTPPKPAEAKPAASTAAPQQPTEPPKTT